MTNNISRSIVAAAFTFLFCAVACAQPPSSKGVKQVNPPAAANPVKSSAAYAEVLLRRTELVAELESLLEEYTEEFPKVRETRLEIDLIQKEVVRLLAVKPEEAGKLSAALGKLMVRKAALETGLEIQRRQHDDKHPDVVSARKKVDVFEKAIKDILGP